MKAKPVDTEEVDLLFSWHVNILQLRKKHIIFVNDYTRLCLIIDGIRSSQPDKLKEKFEEELRRYLQFEGIKKSKIDQYFLETGEISIAKTNSRSVLGTMTEMSLHSQAVEKFDRTIEGRMADEEDGRYDRWQDT